MVAVFVIVMFALFILADFVILKLQKKTHPALEKDSSLAMFNKKSILLPAEFLVSKAHTWAKLLQTGSVQVGIDDFVFKALGKMNLLKVQPIGSRVQKGDVLFEGESAGRTFQFKAPVSGTIKSINNELLGKKIQNPENDWGVELTPSNFANESKDLKSGKELTHWLNEEFARFKEFLNHSMLKTDLAGVTMYDGGNIAEGAVNFVDDESKKNFEKEFLTF